MNTETITLLITGTNRGLGFYLADYFLEKGYTDISLIRSRNSDIMD